MAADRRTTHTRSHRHTAPLCGFRPCEGLCYWMTSQCRAGPSEDFAARLPGGCGPNHDSFHHAFHRHGGDSVLWWTKPEMQPGSCSRWHQVRERVGDRPDLPLDLLFLAILILPMVISIAA